MGNVIFLSINYEYTCSVAEEFARFKDMFFVSTSDMVEYELSVLKEGSDINLVTEQTLLRLLSYDGCVIAMDLQFFRFNKVKELCLKCKNLVYLVLDNENQIFPFSLVGGELEDYFLTRASYILRKDEIPIRFKDIIVKE